MAKDMIVYECGYSSHCFPFKRGTRQNHSLLVYPESNMKRHDCYGKTATQKEDGFK